MEKHKLLWTLSHKKSDNDEPRDIIPATVPGAVQLDYANAFNYAPYWYGNNFEQFTWMEDEYWIYSTTLEFTAAESERAILHFEGIDYAYRIFANGKMLVSGEGAFTPVCIDITEYSGIKTSLEVVISPVPKCEPEPAKRFQARECCKPPSSYGWDWHPRLVPLGIWGECYFEIIKSGCITKLDSTYSLSDDLMSCRINATVETFGDGEATVSLLSPDGCEIYSEKASFSDSEEKSFSFEISAPLLWYPTGYGEQPIYKLIARGSGSCELITKKLGFRRAKLVRNPGDDAFGHPQTRNDAPATFEINGVRVFAKGSNWVNPEIFPCNMTEARYRELIDLAKDANMNIFRCWGGAYINKDAFYDICDEYGIMIWQEFMLSCNLYPDSDEYLRVLEQEAVSIIKRLRRHPSIVLWCGGNELFNSWSGMTDQSHALRLLNSLCYEYDRYTPFNMTSPLNGMAHGYYNNIMDDQSAFLPQLRDHSLTENDEFITVLIKRNFTAYTEFGSCGGASPEYVKKYITDGESFENCTPENSVWVKHHAFKAWNVTSWLRKSEAEYYFGGYTDTEDLLRKTSMIQTVCYKTLFEEMRKQAPRCSMAINWDYNEPWPCAAGNSLVSWPAEPKPALESVRLALRPTLASIRAFKNRYVTGDTLTAEVWMLNDSANAVPPCEIKVYLETENGRKAISTVSTDSVDPRNNCKFGEFKIEITEDIPSIFKLILEVPGNPEYSSEYTMFKR